MILLPPLEFAGHFLPHDVVLTPCYLAMIPIFFATNFLYQKISQKISDGYSKPSDGMYVPIYVCTYIYICTYIYYVHKNEQVYFQENVKWCVFNITHEKVCFHSKNKHSVYTHRILRKGLHSLPPPSLPSHSPSCSLAPPDLLS